MFHTSSIRWSKNSHRAFCGGMLVLVCKFLKIHACLHDLSGLWIMISRNADKLVSLGLRMTCSWSTSWKDQVFQMPQDPWHAFSTKHKWCSCLIFLNFTASSCNLQWIFPMSCLKGAFPTPRSGSFILFCKTSYITWMCALRPLSKASNPNFNRMWSGVGLKRPLSWTPTFSRQSWPGNLCFDFWHVLNFFHK